MEFTRYYANLLKTKGVLQLNVAQTQRLFNIITLEIRINEIEHIRNQPNVTHSNNDYMRMKGFMKQLKLLNNSLPPDMVVADMLKCSNVY